MIYFTDFFTDKRQSRLQRKTRKFLLWLNNSNSFTNRRTESTHHVLPVKFQLELLQLHKLATNRLSCFQTSESFRFHRVPRTEQQRIIKA